MMIDTPANLAANKTTVDTLTTAWLAAGHPWRTADSPGKHARTVRRFLRSTYGALPLFDYQYGDGSRSVADFLESILRYALEGCQDEAEYWASELRCLVSGFALTR